MHHTDTMGSSKNSVKRKAYSNWCYIKKLERHQINDLSMNVKDLEKQEHTKLQSRKNTIKISKIMNTIEKMHKRSMRLIPLFGSDLICPWINSPKEKMKKTLIKSESESRYYNEYHRHQKNSHQIKQTAICHKIGKSKATFWVHSLSA